MTAQRTALTSLVFIGPAEVSSVYDLLKLLGKHSFTISHLVILQLDGGKFAHKSQPNPI